MGLFGIAPLPCTFSCTGIVDRSSVSVYGCQIYSLNSSPSVCASIPRGKTGILSCPQDRVNGKKSQRWKMTKVCVSCTLGLQGQVHPMVFPKNLLVSQGCLAHTRAMEGRRRLCFCTSVVQSSVKKPDAEEFLIESHCKDNAHEEHLPYGLDPHSMPKHVAIIMDGNSRWAEKRGLPATAGHEAGRRALSKVVKLSCKWGIKILTVFAFSTDNWLRPKTEINFLMDLFQIVLKEELENFNRENIRLSVIGDLSRLSNSLQILIAEAEHRTKENSQLNLIVGLSYSGRDDILQACQQLAKQVDDGLLKPTDITESMFEKELKTSCAGGLGSPDLLIRTSGEQRLSNFLLWQLAYTELYFADSFWPEFGEAQYAEALYTFQCRQRRFGKRVYINTNDTLY